MNLNQRNKVFYLTMTKLINITFTETDILFDLTKDKELNLSWREWVWGKAMWGGHSPFEQLDHWHPYFQSWELFQPVRESINSMMGHHPFAQTIRVPRKEFPFIGEK